MKALVTYSSQTGNTRKLAQTIYDSLTCEKQIHPLADAPEPAAFDLVALGFWLQTGKPDPKSAEYLSRIGEKDLFLFATHGAAAGSDHARAAMEHAKSLAPAARIRGTFSCQGEVNPKVLEKARAKNPPPSWLKDAPDAVGRPNDKDLQALEKALKEAIAAG
jgi:flavodoxin I